MLLKHLLFFLGAILSPHLLKAQSGVPLPDCTEIALTFDASGKLSSPPLGFALIQGKRYKLNITVKKPEQQQKALWKSIADKCKATLYQLDDPDDSLGLRFKNLYYAAAKYQPGSATILDTLKAELREMDSILTDKSPIARFDRSGNNFSFFLGKDFIRNQLFGNIFVVSVQTKFIDTTFTKDVNSDFVIPPQTFTCPEDSFVVTVRIADLQKQFLKNYYTQARQLVKSTFDPILPTRFYTKDLPEIYALQQRFDSLYKVVTGLNRNDLLICDSNIIDRYHKLNESYNKSMVFGNLGEIIQSKWLGYWFWYNEGVMKINPLPFTDKKLLPLKEGYDKSSADIYNAYIDSVIVLMRSSTILNETKADYARMDSLLRQQKKGDEKFNFASYNKSLEQANGVQAKALQTIEYAHQLVFKSIPDKKADNYMLRTYNADKQLMGSKENFSTPVSNKIKVDAMIYNLKVGQTVAFKETSVDIKDQSEAITQLDEIGDVLGDVWGKAASTKVSFSNLVDLFDDQRPDLLQIKKINIQPKKIGDSVQELDYMKEDSLITIKYSPKLSGNNLRVNLLTGDGNIFMTRNILESVDETLQDSNLITCPLFVEKVHQGVKNYILTSQKVFPKDTILTTKAAKDGLNSLSQGIADIIMKLYGKYCLACVYDDLATKRNGLTIATDLFRSPANHTLPPKEFKSEKDQGSLYRNQYEAFVKEKTAKQKDFELVLTDTKTKKEIKFKDLYETAPPHWVTGSLGVAYIFNSFRRSEATIINGTLTNTPDEDKVRLAAGLHFYVCSPIILIDDRSIFQLKGWKEVRSRLSIFTGASFPKPLYNLHLGLSADLWAGVKFTAGTHFYRFTSYTILNNQIADQNSRYRINGAFCSLSIAPDTFVKLIGLFK